MRHVLAYQPQWTSRPHNRQWVMLVVVVLLAVTGVEAAEDGNVTTIARTTAKPYGVHIVPATGVVLFTQHHSLQRVYSNGTVEVVAGSDTSGTSDGVGSAAFFNYPYSVTTSAGDPNRAYVADDYNHCLRHVDLTTRNVTVLAGLCGTLGSDDGVATAARFYNPCGLALFHNTTSATDVHLYVADCYNHIVRRFEVATGAVTTFAGRTGLFGTENGPRASTAHFYYPHDVTVDSAGWVYVADTYNQCIRRIDVSSGMVSTLAGLCGNANAGFTDGAGGAARLKYPRGLIVDSTGNALYVSDYSNCAIRRINTTDGNVTTLSSQLRCSGTGLVDGPLSTARFNDPLGIRHYVLRGIASTGGESVHVEEGLVIADRENAAIRRVVLRRVTELATAGITSTLSSLSATAPTPSTVASMTGSPTHATYSRSASGTVTSSAPATHSKSVTASASNNNFSCSSTRPTPTASVSVMSMSMSRSASHPMSSATAASAGSAPLSVSLSVTVSNASWACAAYDPRNVSIVDATPSMMAEAFASFRRRILSVTAAAVDATATTAQSGPTERLALQSSVQLNGAPLPRVALLTTLLADMPLLLLGLSLRWGSASQWNVVSAVSVRHSRMPLMFNTTTTTTTTTSALSMPSYAIAVLLWPPPSSVNGWVAAGLEAVYTPTEIVIELGLACAKKGGNTSGGLVAMVRVVVPAPGHPRELAENVETVTTVTQWMTAVGGPGAGSAVGRVGAVRSMALCGGSGGASGGGLIGLRLGCGDGRNDGETQGSVVKFAARGAIVGNASILCSCVALLVVLTTLYSKAVGTAFAKGALRLAAPSVLLPVWIATLPSTSAGAMELLLSNYMVHTTADCAWDVAAAVLGLLVCAAPLAWICFVWLRLVRLLGLHVTEMPEARTLTCAGRCGRLRVIAQDALRLRTCWVVVCNEALAKSTGALDTATGSNASHPTASCSTTVSPEETARVAGGADGGDVLIEHPRPALPARTQRARQALVLLHEFRVLWYAALDAGVLVASGVLAASSGAGSHNLCVGTAATVCALYALQLVLCAAARPFTTHFAFVHALMTLTLSAASVALQTGGIAEASGGDNGAASLERQEKLSMASAVCDSCVIGISLVRVVVEVINGFKAIASIAKEVRFARNGAVQAPKEPSSIPAVAPATTPPTSMPDVAATIVLPDITLEPVLLGSDDDNDLLFWDAAGNALQQDADGEGLLVRTADGASVDGAALGLPPLPLHADNNDEENINIRETPQLERDGAAAYAAVEGMTPTQPDALEL